jgi:hypothetical protein
MHEYDVALKDILTRAGSSALAQLTGAASVKWLTVEAPKVSKRHVDLLGELPDRSLVHIELQSRNEKDQPLRMAEYLFGIAPIAAAGCIVRRRSTAADEGSRRER